MVTINIGRKEAIFFGVVILVFVLAGFAIAFDGGQPSIHGHDANEIANLPAGGGSNPMSLSSCEWTAWDYCTAWQTANQLTCPAGKIATGVQKEGCTSSTTTTCDDAARCGHQRLYCCAISGTVGSSVVYDSGWFSATISTTYTQNHGLGVVPTIIQLWVSDTADGSGRVVIAPYGETNAYGLQIVDVDSTSIKLRANNFLVNVVDAGGSGWQPQTAYVKIKAIA